LYWAIYHADHHKLNGVVYVGPLKSIIEQTAQTYREVLGDENVLEHHSGYEPNPDKADLYKLNTERWDKPFICTSGVQFYETLFSNKAGKIRKLSNLMNRVILIDEAQTIPQEIAEPILDVLNTLVQDWGCTVVLMSATQPAFDRLEAGKDAVDIVSQDDVIEQYRLLRRNTYRLELNKSWNWENLGNDIIESGFQQTLTIVNTTKTSREGYQELRERISGDWFHLSARMCPAHRNQVLTEVKQRLENDRPCHLISTQLVEAGIDIDFPRVYRQVAPLDSIVQSAGRCNRNGLLPVEQAIVTVVDLEEAQDPPGDYKRRIDVTRQILKDSNILNREEDMLDAIQHYFREIYNKLFVSDKNNIIQSARLYLDFPKVAEEFKIIDDNNASSAVVPWQNGKQLIEKLRDRKNLTQSEWRSIQPYSATVPKNHKNIEKLDNGLVIWCGEYDPEVGCLT
jgi:CRISPR-associated endonuclease/helicase Cas3